MGIVWRVKKRLWAAIPPQILQEWVFRRKAREAARLRRLLGPSALAIIADTHQGLVAVSPFDREVGAAVLRSGSFASDEVRRLSERLTQESRVLVVGAHVGTLVIPLARIAREVVVLEANPETFRLLEINLAINKISNCHLIQGAASDSQQPIRFLANTLNSGGSKREPVVKDSRYYYDTPGEIVVNALVLDDRLSGQRFDLIVMDIEGSEYFALRGAQRLLQDADALQVEFVPHHLRLVAGVSVQQFVATLEPHFDLLHVPSMDMTVPIAEANDVLSNMYQRERHDPALLFFKTASRHT